MTPSDPVAGDDRYRPPLARVEDGARVAARGARPITVWIAALMLFAAAAGEFVPLLNGGGLGKFTLAQQLAMLASFGAVMLIDFALIVLMFRGAGWARLAYLAVYAFTVNAALTGKVSTLEVLKVAAQTIAMILLFVPPAGAWFRRRDS